MSKATQSVRLNGEGGERACGCTVLDDILGTTSDGTPLHAVAVGKSKVQDSFGWGGLSFPIVCACVCGVRMKVIICFRCCSSNIKTSEQGLDVGN